jgi:Lar family restriction alleviation protein
MTTNLKPCPFCGGEPTDCDADYGNTVQIRCPNCAASSDYAGTLESAIKLWNTRQHPISTELPTEPGPYWWRKNDKEEWQSIIMMDGDWLFTYGPSMRTTEHCDMARFLVLHGIGQWIKIERPEV